MTLHRYIAFWIKLCVFELDDDGSIKRDENGLVARSKTDVKAQVERISFEHTKRVTEQYAWNGSI